MKAQFSNTPFTKITIFVIIIIALSSKILYSYAQSNITVSGDTVAVQTISLANSTELDDEIGTVQDRVILQYADDSLADIPLVDSAELDSYLDNVQPRIVLQYADNALGYIPLLDSAELNSYLETVQPRLVLQHADRMGDVMLTYPYMLVNDTETPVVTAITDTIGTNDTIGNLPTDVDDNDTIEWNTDEFATTGFECGIESGVYTFSIVISFHYTQEHTITFSDLMIGISQLCTSNLERSRSQSPTEDVTFYYRVFNTDISGNTMYSDEGSITTPPLSISVNRLHHVNHQVLWGVVGVAVCILTIASYSAWRRRVLR